MADVTLGGRRFEVIDFDRRTVLQDHYMMSILRAIGADRILPSDEEGDSVYMARLQLCVVDSLKAPDLIAGLLLPDGTMDWTPEIARATAKYIGALNTEEDREQVTQFAVDVVMGFFEHGVETWRRLMSYGTEASASVSAPSVQTH